MILAVLHEELKWKTGNDEEEKKVESESAAQNTRACVIGYNTAMRLVLRSFDVAASLLWAFCLALCLERWCLRGRRIWPGEVASRVMELIADA